MGPEPQIVAGKYRVEGVLGEGGMGVVHAAVNIYSGQRVALKQISVNAPERHALTDRLLKESKALAQLDHPNVVRLLDCGRTERGDLYIAMELVEGESLRALIRGARRQERLLPLDLVLTVAAQAAEAMEFAHEKGVYHRDLKPENLIVSPGGRAKVVDFGLAKSAAAGDLPVAGAKPPAPTNPAKAVGTPRYMAPEQVRGLKVDARTDIYALGVTLYEAISGRTPYDVYEDGATITELMGHHVFADPTPVREHVPSCPDRVWNILHRCLAKAPEDRYPHMHGLARDLRAALEELDAPEAPAARNVAAEQAAPRAPRETEPMPPPAASKSLPFVKPAEAPAPAPREARETEPMPPSFTPAGSALPFVAPARRPLLGVGHTQPLRSASALLSDARAAAAAGPSRSALPPPPPSTQPTLGGAPPAPVGPRDSGDGGLRSGPGFAFDSTQPGTLPHPFATRPSPPARVPASSARRMKPSMYVLPSLTGLALAVASMIAIMRLHDAPPEAPRPILVPAASIAPPDPEVKPSATVEQPLPVAADVPPAPPSADVPVDSPAASPSGAPSVPALPAKTSVPAGSARRPASPRPTSGRPRAVPAAASPATTTTTPKSAPHRMFGTDQ
jgi:serine/threonine-protein kinase